MFIRVWRSLHIPDQLRAKRGTQTIELSLRDVRILQYLHSRRGRVITRSELFKKCWDIDFFEDSRPLDQHISQLRKRIELDPKSPILIRTVHGYGYRYDGYEKITENSSPD